MRSEGRRFGDLGTETAPTGERTVMWIAPERVVILASTIPTDMPGDWDFITYEVSGTKWGLRSDIDLAERLEIHVKRLDNPPELLK